MRLSVAVRPTETSKSSSKRGAASGRRRVMLALGLFCWSQAWSPMGSPAAAQSGAADGQWRSYGGDSGHTKYSALDQINEDNVGSLEVAWTWTSVDEGLRARNEVMRVRGAFQTYAYEVTPLYVNGVLYTTTSLGQVAAIDPATGETLWSYDPALYLEGRPAVHGFMTRGLAYWTDGAEERLIYAGGRVYLVSIDAKTGEPDLTFGRGGRVDLKEGLGRTIDARRYTVSSPPLVVGDIVVVGSAMTEGTGYKEAPPGHVRGYVPPRTRPVSDAWRHRETVPGANGAVALSRHSTRVRFGTRSRLGYVAPGREGTGDRAASFRGLCPRSHISVKGRAVDCGHAPRSLARELRAITTPFTAIHLRPGSERSLRFVPRLAAVAAGLPRSGSRPMRKVAHLR